jgi:hypothetical protein
MAQPNGIVLARTCINRERRREPVLTARVRIDPRVSWQGGRCVEIVTNRPPKKEKRR